MDGDENQEQGLDHRLLHYPIDSRHHHHVDCQPGEEGRVTIWLLLGAFDEIDTDGQAVS